MKNRATFRAHLKNPRRRVPAHEGAGAYNVTAITHSSDFTIYSPSIPGYYIGTGSKLCTCEICQKARPGSYLSISGQLRSTMALKILQAFRLLILYWLTFTMLSFRHFCCRDIFSYFKNFIKLRHFVNQFDIVFFWRGLTQSN